MANSSQFIDITLPLTERLAVWPGDTPVTIERSTGIAAVSELHIGSHAGTHLDAPRHFLSEGLTVDQIPLDTLIGPAWVAHIPQATIITADLLRRALIPAGTERLIFRTDNSTRPPRSSLLDGEHAQDGPLPFDEGYVALDTTAGRWLLANGVRLIGIDGPSVDPFIAQGYPVHHALLAAQVIVVENLSLAHVAAGAYRLICLPMRYEGGDGCPVRAILEYQPN
jgi:arylformamidase